MGVLRDDRSQPFDLTKAPAFGKSKGPRPIGAPFTGRISGDFGRFSHGFFQPKMVMTMGKIMDYRDSLVIFDSIGTTLW